MLSFGQTDGQTERQTDTGKKICPQSFDAGAIKNIKILPQNLQIHPPPR